VKRADLVAELAATIADLEPLLAPAPWRDQLVAQGAAGFDIEVAWVGGGTLVASGNSFAAAVISGHLARIVGAHPGITPWQARTVLASVGRNAPV
jgi:hypothetical protein